jgi:hypothetical protein
MTYGIINKNPSCFWRQKKLEFSNFGKNDEFIRRLFSLGNNYKQVANLSGRRQWVIACLL